ncbi:MAG: OmpP1/FadL family transporter [Myxococcota bacterium]
MRCRTTTFVLVFFAAALASAPTAHAGGFEYPGRGAKPLGRGGAFTAGADDSLALQYNPAMLGSLPDPQANVDLNWPLYQYCQTRYWDDGTPRIGPKVCNDATALPAPNVGFAMRVHPMFGFGVGLITPSSVNKVQFPNSQGTVFDPDEDAFVPAPTRYSLVERDVLLTFPAVGVGFSPAPWLKLGVTFGWGIAHVNFTTTAHATGGEDADSDIVTSLDGKDSFVPRVIASVASEPVPGLDIALRFMWTDDIKAKGDLNMRFGPGVAELLNMFSEDEVVLDDPLVVQNARIHSPQPWLLAFGLRYGHQRAGFRGEDSEFAFGGAVDDRMATEVWDVELNVLYERNSAVDAIRVKNPEGLYIFDGSPDEEGVGLEVPVPSRISLAHQWKDQLSIRLGGDYNVVPEILALRAGVSFETAGVPDAYNQLDFRPAQRFGLHLGLTVRIDRFDLSLAYAHLFEQTVENQRGEGEIEQTVGDAELNGMPISIGSPTVVNDGKFESSYDVFALGLGYHF